MNITKENIDLGCQQYFPAFPGNAVMTDTKAIVVNSVSSVKVSASDDSPAELYRSEY